MRTEAETGVTSLQAGNTSNQQMLGEEPGTDFLQEPSERRAWPAGTLTSDSFLQSRENNVRCVSPPVWGLRYDSPRRLRLHEGMNWAASRWPPHSPIPTVMNRTETMSMRRGHPARRNFCFFPLATSSSLYQQKKKLGTYEPP